jgi:hypothetical protein
MEAALPAAPAAVRLIHATFLTHSKLQQLAGREDTPASIRSLARDAAAPAIYPISLPYSALVDITFGIADCSKDGRSQQLLPGARELLLCPDLVPCIAIALLVAVFGLDTGARASSKESVRSATSSTKSRDKHRKALHVPGSLQQQRLAATDSSAGCHQAGTGSSSLTSRASNTGRLANGMSLDSLTPLSRNLFGLLGVDQAVVLQAAAVRQGPVVIYEDSLVPSSFPPQHLSNLISVYQHVVEYQVSEQNQRLLDKTACVCAAQNILLGSVQGLHCT